MGGGVVVIIWDIVGIGKFGRVFGEEIGSIEMRF